MSQTRRRPPGALTSRASLLIDLGMVVLLGGILAVIVVQRVSRVRDQSIAAMRTDIELLSHLQDEHFGRTGRFTDRPTEDLPDLELNPGIVMGNAQTSDDGWSAVLWHRTLPVSCTATYRRPGRVEVTCSSEG